MDTSEAIRIIRALADGIDPETGEVLERDSPCSRPSVIRALFAAIKALESRVKVESRSKNLPVNAGNPWGSSDDATLGRRFDENVTVADLAREFQRTEGSIRARLQRIGKLEHANLAARAAAPSS